NSATCMAVVTVIRTTPTVVYVDDDYTGLPNCTAVDFPYPGAPGGSHIIGYDAFATVQGGVDAVAANGTVNVAPGTYIEDVQIPKALSLIGPNAGKAGTDPTRVAEAILMPATDDPEAGQIVYVAASGVTIDGLLFNGDNPALNSGYS